MSKVGVGFDLGLGLRWFPTPEQPPLPALREAEGLHYSPRVGTKSLKGFFSSALEYCNQNQLEYCNQLHQGREI